MQYEIFTIPVFNSEEQIEKLNSFLRGHKVVQVDKELVRIGEQSYWSFCVNYLITTSSLETEKKDNIDYKNVLDEETFKIFSKLRSCRKSLSLEKGCPVYSIFTNAELALISQSGDLTIDVISKIDGISKSRMKNFGALILELYYKNNEEVILFDK